MISNDETHQEEKEDLNYDSYDDEADNYSDDEFGLEEEAIPSDIQARRFQAAEQQRLGQQQPTGTLTLVDTEKDVMDMTTAHAQVVVHFAHRDFKRCRIMDAHLQALARQYPNTRFIKIFVENASFLVERLKIRVLPCVVCFVDAVTVDKIIGFEGVSEEKDEFPTSALEWRLVQSMLMQSEEVITKPLERKSVFGIDYTRAQDEDYEDEYA